MDVVLLQDVEQLGTQGTVVHVKPGFARNYLLPRGLAAPATPQRLKATEETKRQRQQKGARLKDEAEALKRKLESRPVTLKLNVGEDGKAFGSVTAHDVVEALKRDGLDVDKHAVHLDQPIKTLGVFDVPVRVQSDVTATVKLLVVKA